MHSLIMQKSTKYQILVSITENLCYLQYCKVANILMGERIKLSSYNIAEAGIVHYLPVFYFLKQIF